MRALFHCAALVLDREIVMKDHSTAKKGREGLLIFGLTSQIQPLVLRIWFEASSYTTISIDTGMLVHCPYCNQFKSGIDKFQV